MSTTTATVPTTCCGKSDQGCVCASQAKYACSCEKAPDGGLLPTETDFTTKASGA
ncbi:MAG: hypothetical protein Q9170_007653 [Blastenia crenularia]